MKALALLQPLALVLQPLLGGEELRGAARHLLLEPLVGALQLLVERDVVEGGGEPAAEHLDQRLVGVASARLSASISTTSSRPLPVPM